METENERLELPEKPKKRVKFADRWGALFALTSLLMLVGQMCGIVLEFIPGLANSPVLFTSVLYFEFIGIWFITLLYLRFTKKNRPILQILWTSAPGNNLKNLGIGLLAGFGMNAVCILGAFLNRDIHLTFDCFQIGNLLLIFVAVFIQSSAEELLCRGFLYQRLLRSYKKPWAAIVGNSAFFALLHLFNNGVTALSLLNILTVGILFSLMVYYMDSIWCAMAAHAAWNFTQNILFGLPNSGMMVPYSVFKLDTASATNSFAYNVGFGVEGTLLCDVVLIIGCVVLYLWGKNHGVTATEVWEE